MATRRGDLGSWLEGTPGAGPDDGLSAIGLPQAGPGALASVQRRLLAVTVDWVMSLAVSGTFFAQEGTSTVRLLSGDPVATLAVFALSTVVLVGLLGHTIGHRLLGVRVIRLRAAASAGGQDRVTPPGLLASLIRTVLLCLVIPAVVWDSSGRGLHDVASGTAIVRR